MNTETPLTKQPEEHTLKVSATTNVGKLAGSMKKTIEADPSAIIILRFVGAGACNQAVKAIIIFNQMMSSSGYISTTIPYYAKKDERKDDNHKDEKAITIIELRLKLQRT